MGDQYKNVTIAVFVLAAISIITFIFLFIHPTVGDEKKVLHVRFTDIDKVNLGTRVTYGGKPVGEVVGVREIMGEKDHRASRDGKIYLYELELHVDSSVHVFNTDEIATRTSGLLGEKSVAITPYPPRPGEKMRLVENEVIYANETGSVEQTFREFKEVADKFDNVLDNLSRILEDLQHEQTFKNVARTASNIADITSALNNAQEISDILSNFQDLTMQAASSWKSVDQAVRHVDEAAENIRDVVAMVNQPETLTDIVENVHQVTHKASKSWDTFDRALVNFAATTASTSAIAQSFNKPREIDEIISSIHGFTYQMCHSQGTINKLFFDDDFYLRLTSILNKGEVLFNDVNHYGLLFHMDKGWQRLRARRLNLLAKLCSPADFRNFFNDEIDNISTSLARVNMLLMKNEEAYPCGLLIDNSEFSKVYAELLRRVSTMEESLKMYNQQLIDSQLPRTEVIAPVCR